MNNKVSTSTEKNNNSIYTKIRNGIIAGSLFFTLGSQPAEAKTVEKNSNPIEMTSEKSASPTVENAEQQATPDYISQVETGVIKYYPQYVEYFETILETINGLPMRLRNSINSTIHDNFELFEDDIETEKDKITTILMFYEIYLGNNYFSNQNDVKKILNELGYDIRFSAAKEMNSGYIKSTGKRYQEFIRINFEVLKEKKNLIKKRGKGDIPPETMQGDIENLLTIRIKLFNQNLINRSEINNYNSLINEIKDYIRICNITGKKPTPIGQKFIDEYNKIK